MIKKIFVILLLAIIFISNAINIVNAAFKITDAYIEKIGNIDFHLKYYKEEKGMSTYCTCDIVGYKKDGKFYPAYCLNRDLHGVGAVENYTVDVDSLLDNNEVWRAVKNGYPYKTASEMGLSSDYNAFAVTKFAIYCLIGQADINLYSADEKDKEGQAMLKALNNLYEIGKNGKETYSENLKITKESELIEENDYYSLVFKVTSSVNIESYDIKNITGISEKDLITDEAGNIKTHFLSGEKFKIKIHKSNLNSNKDIKIDVMSNLKSYPMFYGKTRIEGTQNYLLTANTYKEQMASTSVKLNLNTGKIVLNKIDTETKKGISDTTFELYNAKNELIETKTTNNDGKIEFLDLFAGDYILKETKANDNYILENLDYKVKVDYNKTTGIDIENRHKKGNLEIYKVDKDNKNIFLGNVEFELYSKENSKLIGTYYTDVNGKIEVNNLNVGEYLLKEKSTNKWYEVAKDTELEIKENETTNKTIENELKKGQIKIIKVDKENKEVKLENVKFEVLDEKNNVLETVVTDKNGEALTKKYPIRDFSKLTIKEVETQENYILNNEEQTIVLEENKIKTMEFENELKKGQIKVIKLDLDNQEIKLKDVEFKVYDENDNLVDTLITDENGEAISKKLRIDKEYRVSESKTLSEYVLNETPKKVTLKQDEITNLTFENELKKGQIKVIKVDKDNTEVKLKDVEFKVYDEKNNLVDTLITNEEGEAISKRLRIDKEYSIVETKTLSNYILNETPKKITLTQDQITDIVFENEKIKGKIKIVKTSEDDSKIENIKKDDKLKDVKFEIYNNKDELVDTIITNNEGIAVSKNLEKGKYKVKEVETLKWYLIDDKEYYVEIEKNEQIVELNLKNMPANPEEKVEKTGPNIVTQQEEIEYKINVENSGNTNLESFILEDKIPTEFIKVTKIKLGTYNQEKTYDLYYKTNYCSDYILFMEDLNTKKDEEIDFLQDLADGEFITEIKFDFGDANMGFKNENDISLFAKINENVKHNDIFENNVFLKSNYKDYNLEENSKWQTKIYKILPVTGM